MRRLGIGLAVLAACAAAAAPAFAANKRIEVKKAFQFLGNYQKLPIAERNRFTLAYTFKIGGQPMTAPVWIEVDGKRAPFPLDASGRAQRLPTPAELDHGTLEFGLDEATKIGLNLGIEPLMAPAADLDAHELAEAIAQAAVGSKKAAGFLALAVPKLDDIAFVGAGSGEVEFADGRRAPLPIVKGYPTYRPSTQPGAKTIHLAKVPAKLDID